MMLDNQITSLDTQSYGYDIMDTNLPAIDKLTSATLKYWNPATDDDRSNNNNATTAAVLLKNGEFYKNKEKNSLTASALSVFLPHTKKIFEKN